MAIQSSIKFERESRDFAVIVEDQIVGWRATHCEAEALMNETVTRILEQRAAADALDAEIPTCCESCGAVLAPEDAFIADDLAVCGDCYGTPDSRRAYREALEQQGAIEDAAVDKAQVAA